MKSERTNRWVGQSRKRIALISVISILLMIVLGGGLYIAARRAELEAGSHEVPRGDLKGRFEEPRIVEYKGKKYQYRTDLLTILLAGIDRTEQQAEEASGFRNGGQADFLSLLIIDPKKETVTPLQIDRDTMTEITVLGILGNVAGTRNAQICLSHGFGDGKMQSGQFTAEAVSKLLFGVNVDFFMTIQLEGIGQINDALGGVPVTIEDDFSAMDPTMVPGATLTLHGKQAEYFVRSRMNIGVGTNESRMVRQRQYLNNAGELLDLRMQENPNFVGKLFDSLGEYLVTDLSRGRMINEAYGSRNYRRNDIITPKGEHVEGEDGFVEFHVDQSALEELVLAIFFEPVAP